MTTSTIKQLIFLSIISTIMYHTGKYVVNMNSLDTLYEGAITMVFFFSIFPFITYAYVMLKKLVSFFYNIVGNLT